jgi:hypothetical protein
MLYSCFFRCILGANLGKELFPMDFTNKRVAFYLRGKSNKTLDRQMTEILIFASRNNIQLNQDNVYIDETDSSDERPNLLRLLRNHDKFDVVVMLNYAILHIDFTHYKRYAEAMTQIMDLQIHLLEGSKCEV